MLPSLFRNSMSGAFRTRAPARDQELDEQLVGQVASAISDAMRTIETQREGLKRRLDDVIARAAIVGGNDLDDYLTRDDTRASLLAASDDEIARGQARLKQLEENLAHFRCLLDALQARFPHHRSDAESAGG